MEAYLREKKEAILEDRKNGALDSPLKDKALNAPIKVSGAVDDD